MDEASKGVICAVARGSNVGNKDRHVGEELMRRGYLRDEGGKFVVCSSTFREFVLEPSYNVSANKPHFPFRWVKKDKRL
jgi:hypothetical protein